MSELLITVIVILFPGILAAIVFDKITHHSKWDSFKFSLYSFTLGIFCYSLLQLIYFGGDILKSKDCEIEWTWLSIWSQAKNPNGELSPSEIIFATLLSTPIALAASFAINHKIFNKLAKLLKVSQKFGDENLYSYYLNSKDINWVYVRDEREGITYQGQVISFSERSDVQEIVLSDVSVYRTEDSEPMYNVPSIYICKNLGDMSIEAIPKERMGDENEQ